MPSQARSRAHRAWGARDLDRISDTELASLSADTGIPVERMREMNCASIQARMNGVQGGPLTEEGGAALDELRIAPGRVARRR